MLRNSSESRDSPATSQHALRSARTSRNECSVGVTSRIHFLWLEKSAAKALRTNAEPKRLARNPADPPHKARGCFPRRPPDAANSFALCWARSAPHRKSAAPGRGEESPLSSQAVDPQPRIRRPDITAPLLATSAGTQPAARRAARPCRSRTPPAALPAGSSGEKRGERGRPAEPVALTPRASPSGSRPPAPPPSAGDADGRRDPLPPGGGVAAAGGRGPHAGTQTRGATDLPAAAPCRSAGTDPPPCPAAFPRRRPQSPPLSASCARHRPVPPPAPAARPGPAGGVRPVPAVPRWEWPPRREPPPPGPGLAPHLSSARHGEPSLRSPSKPAAPCFSPSLARGCCLRSSLGEICGEGRHPSAEGLTHRASHPHLFCACMVLFSLGQPV